VLQGCWVSCPHMQDTCAHTHGSSHARSHTPPPTPPPSLRLLLLQELLASSDALVDQLWRDGALAALIVTACKRAELGGLEDSVTLGYLVDLIAPAPAGQLEPWYDASPERQQVALFLLARVGSRAAATVLALTQSPTGTTEVGTPEVLSRLVGLTDRLQTGAHQLSLEPALRELLEVGAPAVVPASDKLDAILVRQRVASRNYVRPVSSNQALFNLLGDPLYLLEDLGRQLDALALDLALPGCWNPACTSLAGASEAGMPLKTCTSCKIAK